MQKALCFIVISILLSGSIGIASANNMEPAITGECVNNLKYVSPTGVEETDLNMLISYGPFKGYSFPQMGTIAPNKTIIYDSVLRQCIECTSDVSNNAGSPSDICKPSVILHSGDEVLITGISSKYIVGPTDDKYFFVLGNGMGLVSTRDIILENAIDKPAFVSLNNIFTVIKTPVDGLYSYLWLRTKEGKFVFLSPMAWDILFTFDVPTGLLLQYRFTFIPISWSKDERYMFVELTGKLMKPDGSSIEFSKDKYSSPVWHGDTLFLRGTGIDDAVYALNLNDMKIRKFLDISDGRRRDTYLDSIMTSRAIEIRDGHVTALFERLDDSPPPDVVESGCMTVEVTADMKGEIINKQIYRELCDEETL